MDIPIKVINLRRATGRRESFARENGHLRYEFVDAVDGRGLTPAQLQDPRHFVGPLQFPSAGAYGCALSHLNLWESAIAADRPVTVLEDDVVTRLDFEQASRSLIASLPADWDVVLWGWNFDSILSLMSLAGVSPAVMLFNQDLLRENIGVFQKSTTPPQALALDRCFGTPGYTISAKGARRFRDECFPMKHFEMFFPVLNRDLPNSGIDIAMCRTYSVTQSFAAFPPLVATRNDQATSSVQKR